MIKIIRPQKVARRDHHEQLFDAGNGIGFAGFALFCDVCGAGVEAETRSQKPEIRIKSFGHWTSGIGLVENGLSRGSGGVAGSVLV